MRWSSPGTQRLLVKVKALPAVSIAVFVDERSLLPQEKDRRTSVVCL